jgi:biotin-dependent carboxylase-like uncharacterized protein
MSIEVLSPGLATSVQAAPRTGFRHLGVAGAGALDAWSQAIANLLVGNPPQAATLEATLTGPTLRLERDACVAACGGGFELCVDGIEVGDSRPLYLPAGSTVRVGRARAGARAYIAVRGGIQVEALLGSLSTDLRGGFGGFEGRLLRKGDRLDLAPDAGSGIRRRHVPGWWIDSACSDQVGPARVRVLPGSDATQPADALFAREWTVAAASNRQGLRLTGETVALRDGRERISEPVAPGTIQLPGDGQPIILLADAQTHGGYPRIGHVIRADWPLLAQRRPGDRLLFQPCSREEAVTALARQRQQLARIRLAIRSRQDRHD